MNKLDSLKAAKFRILNDPELKKIVGAADDCYGDQPLQCNGSCNKLGDPLSLCYYSSIQLRCICGRDVIG